MTQNPDRSVKRTAPLIPLHDVGQMVGITKVQFSEIGVPLEWFRSEADGGERYLFFTVISFKPL